MIGGNITIIIGVLALVMGVWFLRHKPDRSERRIKQMLQYHGLDPKTAKQVHGETHLKDAASRCQSCQFESHCDLWLAGNAKGGNGFCPNRQVFNELNRASQPSEWAWKKSASEVFFRQQRETQLDCAETRNSEYMKYNQSWYYAQLFPPDIVGLVLWHYRRLVKTVVVSEQAKSTESDAQRVANGFEVWA